MTYQCHLAYPQIDCSVLCNSSGERVKKSPCINILFQGPYRHYILNFLWILMNLMCVFITLYHLVKLYRDYTTTSADSVFQAFFCLFALSSIYRLLSRVPCLNTASFAFQTEYANPKAQCAGNFVSKSSLIFRLNRRDQKLQRCKIYFLADVVIPSAITFPKKRSGKIEKALPSQPIYISTNFETAVLTTLGCRWNFFVLK